MSAGRTSTTPATSPAMSGLRHWSSYLYISLSGLLLFLSFYLCLFSIAVTVTALHPTRLCRIAVFLVKPTFLSSNLLSLPFSLYKDVYIHPTDVIVINIADRFSHRSRPVRTELARRALF